MNDVKFVYWKRIDTEEARLRCMGYAGCCHAGQVTQYGYVDTLPLPTEVEVSEDGNGMRHLLSPPVFGTSFAYRLKLSFAIKDLAEKSGEEIIAHFHTLRADSPRKDSNKENWWWYAHDSFGWHSGKTPTKLLRKWKGAMIEAALKDHPDREKMLNDWNSVLNADKERRAYARSQRPARSSNKKQHGDLVALPHAIHFQDTGSRQIFEYNISRDSFGKRNKHSLRIGKTTYKVSHSSAATFHDGYPPQEEVKPAIALAMAILAHSRAPLDSNHEILAAHQKFSGPYQAALLRLQGYGQATRPPGEYDVALFRARGDIEAAQAALKDLLKIEVDEGDPVHKQNAMRAIAVKAEDAQAHFAAWHAENPLPKAKKVPQEE